MGQKTVLLRIDGDLHERIKQAAAADSRSVNAWIALRLAAVVAVVDAPGAPRPDKGSE